MGITVWIFIVNDDDSIQRFPLARFERLIQRDPNERLPQYAGKRVRYVEVALELEQRKPVGILRLLYLILPFDSEGRIDAMEQEKERRLGIENLNRSLKLGIDLPRGALTMNTVGNLPKKWNWPLWRPYLDPPKNFWKTEAVFI